MAVSMLGCASLSQAPEALTPSWEGTRSILGIELRVVVRHPEEVLARTAIREAFDAAEGVAALLLATQLGSEIDLLTRVPSHLWVEISPTTHSALVLGARIASETDGAYDYTWPVLQRVWGLREGGTPHLPRDFEIDMALRRVDWEDVELREDDGLQARRLHRRTEIDLGGVARGAMLDAAVVRLVSLGITAGRASTAGEHAFFGGTARHAWRVALPTGQLQLTTGAVAVSRTAEPVATSDGQLFSPTFDPRDGRPIQDARWAMAHTQSAAESAGYAAALLCMGEEGLAFVEARAEIDAALPQKTGGTWVSHGLTNSFER